MSNPASTLPLFALPLAALAGCAEVATPQLGNPAASFCVSEGGEYKIVETQAGQTGICDLPDGRQIDAWEFFRESTTG